MCLVSGSGRRRESLPEQWYVYCSYMNRIMLTRLLLVFRPKLESEYINGVPLFSCKPTGIVSHDDFNMLGPQGNILGTCLRIIVKCSNCKRKLMVLCKV